MVLSADSANTPDPTLTSNVPTNKEANDEAALFDTSVADEILGGVTPDPEVNSTVPEVPSTNQEPQNSLNAEQIASLRQQLGIKDESQSQEQLPQESVQFSESFVSTNNKFKELTGMDLGSAIDAYMQGVVGMDLKNTIETVQSMSAYINTRQGLDKVEQSQAALRSEWGNNYDAYLELAKQEYAKLPDDNLKKSLDNAEGAKLLLAKALQTNGLNGVTKAPIVASTMNFGTSPQSNVSVGQQPKLRLSEILRMSQAQYDSPEVVQAITSGNYIDDMKFM